MTQMAKWKELSDIGIPISTPSPEAIVKAALGKAAEKALFFAELNYAAMNYPEEAGMAASNTAHEIDSDIRSLASDPAEVAAIIKKAGEDRG
jgi:hypothetical protein